LIQEGFYRPHWLARIRLLPLIFTKCTNENASAP
jgi:hypothetical protein